MSRIVVRPSAKKQPVENVSAKPATSVFTIGYQERSALEFIRILRAAKVKTLLDVRAVPLSRRAEFRKNALAALLNDAGITYVGMPTLGTPKHLRDRLKSDNDYLSFFRDFRAYMMTRRADLKAAVEIAYKANTALLCFEREAALCHRSVISRYISSKLNCSAVDL